jgi:hypothetical protein
MLFGFLLILNGVPCVLGDVDAMATGAWCWGGPATTTTRSGASRH